MKILVELRGPLTRYLANIQYNSPHELCLSENATVESILYSLGIAREFVSMMVVNGKKAESSASLEEGDKVILFPPVAGG